MGIYIKNMDMPKNRPEHTYMMVFPSGEVWEVRYDDNRIMKYGTAIEIPTPHGRLIDADALKGDGFYTVVCYTGKMPYEYTAMRIDDAPTVIGAEEVYNQYTDTAGNLHWTGTHSGEHIVRAEEE